MKKAILDFNKQFAWKPEIINAGALRKAGRIVVGGMGGSHLAADLLTAYDPSLYVHVHNDYGLPSHGEERLRDSLLIASSYSGNTEEAIEFAEQALARKLNLAVVAVGGKLADFAKKNNLPHVLIPDTGIQPRSALGFSMVAFAALLGHKKMAAELAQLSEKLRPAALPAAGRSLAKKLFGRVPVIYSSTRNRPIAYIWKIKLNETGKIPAFYNTFPELNHNEMTGFDVIAKTKKLSKQFCFIFLRDPTDHSKIGKRMDVCKRLYEKRGLKVITLPLSGKTIGEKIFNSILLADWTAFYTAELYGAEAEQVPMVEEFKKNIA